MHSPDHPVHLTHAGDQSDRLFIVEQPGRIRIAKNRKILGAPFLDISDQVSCCSERGLLSVAFPNDYVNTQLFYVNYTDKLGDTVVSEFKTMASDEDSADPSSERIILRIPQPYSNHNGGQLAFGPKDGYLYIGVGDGGNGGDPLNNGQRTDTLLGKILRIDVATGEQPYGIPADNPFVDNDDYKDEIWALGLRNPWRFSFDTLNGDLYIGDVGQDHWEEIDHQPGASNGGENYGWRIMEGTHCYNSAECDPGGLTLPVVEYPHHLGCSVTGGHVYRGTAFERMLGMYFYGDYCQGRIWGLKYEQGWHAQELLQAPALISTFGEDERGELYFADYGSGDIYHLIDEHALWLPVVLR
ncbi:MAG: PQQ-dependent sugar dehydrogenase [Chloroflexi bacterium]|nr:PQQ-dependent sugar dehydrogenase [Chloroflexota bacterium]